MKTKFKFLYFVAFILLGVTACKKENIVEETTIPFELKPRDSKSINEVRILFAQTLSKAMQDENLRRFIHEKMQQVYHSDYEMIYLAEKNTIVYDDKKFSEILKSYADPEILKNHGEDFFNTLTDISPLLAINMPDLDAFNATTWNVNYVPDVAAVMEGTPSSFRLFSSRGDSGVNFRNEGAELENPTLSVWDAETYYLLSADGMTYDGPHIGNYMPRIVGAPEGPGGPGDPNGGECDYLLEQALNAMTAYEVTGQYFYLVEHNTLLEMYIDCLGLGGGGGGDPDPCTEPCERDCETLDETLVEFKINGWQVFTNIRNQLFENKYVFHGDVLAATRNSFGAVVPHAGKYVSPTLKKGDLLDCSPSPCQGKWKTANYRIWTDWKQDEFGSPYFVDWAEVDNGSTTFNLSFPFTAKFKLSDTVEISAGVTVGFSRTGDKIVALGNAPVFYCDPILMANNTGSVTFKSN